MRQNVLIFLISFIPSILVAQSANYQQYQGLNTNGLHTYGPLTPFPNNLVADDFGPRQYTPSSGHDPYDWHGGIDFNGPGNDEGDLILAIEGGTISTTSKINTNGFKWITVEGLNSVTNAPLHNITYEHVVADGNIHGNGLLVGGCLTKHVDDPNLNIGDRNNWAIIFHINGNYTAIGPIPNSTVTFNDENNVQRTLIVNNMVSAGGPLAPLGGSGNFPSHAHIQGMTDLTVIDQHGQTVAIEVGLSAADPYTKNILEYVNHTSPGFSISISQQNVMSGIIPVYPGNIGTPLRARVSLNNEGANANRYGSSIMDIEKVEFKIRNLLQSDWTNIKGPSFDQIKLGGRMMNNSLPVGIRGNTLGGWTHTGMEPFAYFNHNYDDFYFSDFYNRIHKNDPMNGGSGIFADYPWDARYFDGNYEVKVAITNAHMTYPHQNNWSSGQSFSIDNFKPFVFGVEAYFSNGPSGQSIYKRHWEFTTKGKISLGLRTSRQVPTPGNPGILTLWALSSEAMTGINARIPGPFPVWKTGQKVGSTDNFGRELWRFDMGASGNLADSTCYAIEFDGTDLAGNQLLKYEIPAVCTTATLTKTLPYRSGPSSWSNTQLQGYDKVHFINLSPCGGNFVAPEECTLTAEEVESTVMYASGEQSNGSVSLSITGEHPNLTFKWTDTNENVVSTSQNLANVPAGTYCIEIKEDCCIVSGCFEVGECKIEVIPLLTHPTAEDPNGGAIHLSMSGGEEPYTYQWANGQPVRT